MEQLVQALKLNSFYNFLRFDLYQYSLNYLRCVKCHSKLELESYLEDEQIHEGILSCVKCNLVYPIIDDVAFLWNDFASYLYNRPRLGGELLLGAKTEQIKSFVKKALSGGAKIQEDASIIEKNWTKIYESNKNSEFYDTIKKSLDFGADLALEHGCSIGIVIGHLAQKCKQVFGIDRSFYAIRETKKLAIQNADFFVADSIDNPFGQTQFGLVVGLNILELIEPKKLLRLLANQIQKNGTLVLSDPYDYERGEKSVREPLYENDLRQELAKLGFTISDGTKKPSHIQWNLHLHNRATLQYLVDLIIASKS